MYPHERSLAEQYADAPFTLLGVNSDRIETLRRVIVEESLVWPMIHEAPDSGLPLSEKWGVRGIPSIWLIDHKGRIRYKHVRGEDLDRAVADLVERAERALK
jgi:peroxiredoxin